MTELVCQTCGARPFGLLEVFKEGDICGKKCKGYLVDVAPTIIVEEENETAMPLPVLSVPSLFESENAVREVLGDRPPTNRELAVSKAQTVLVKDQAGKQVYQEELDEIRSLFADLGSIHRPERGFPDMAKARDKHKGQFFTSPIVGELIWALVQPPENSRVLESCIGSGNLIADPSSCYVTGIDVDKEAVTVARALLGSEHCIIHDEMQHHQFRGQFDLVLGNPPYSVSIRDRAQLWSHSVGWDGWGRAEIVWLEQAALAVRDEGTVVAILPVGMYDVFTPKFARWLDSKLYLVAEVILPKDEAHVFSKWPVSLYFWQRQDYHDPHPLTFEIKSLGDALTSVQEDKHLCYLWNYFHTGAIHSYDRPVVIKSWHKEEKIARTLELSEEGEDVVSLRISNGGLLLVPHSVMAQAILNLIQLEMGNRFDHKREIHLWLWEELLHEPPLLAIGKITRMFYTYGVGFEVESASLSWLKKRYRWWRRQVFKIPRVILQVGES